MHPKIALPFCLSLILGSSPATMAADLPPAAAAWKEANINVNAQREGGLAVDIRDVKELTEERWKQIESLPDLRRFSANGVGFDDAGLARAAKISTIETFFFNGPSITDQGLSVLATMPRLKRFGVDHSTKITGNDLGTLKTAPLLTALHFGGCIVGDSAVTSLVQIKQLQDLALGHDRITRASFPLLAKMPALQRLEITPNWDPRPYTAADFSTLAAAPALQELEIHDMVLPWANGLDAFQKTKSLKVLKLYWCYLTDEDIAAAKAHLPGVEIDVRNKAGEDRLQEYQKRVAALKTAK